jgi:hypothetical protein
VEELLSFIEVADLELSRPSAVLTLVQSALDECPEDDPRFPYLVQIEEDLLGGTVPQQRLQAFALRFPRQTPVAEDLESEFRAMAAQFTEEQWRTSAYVDLENALLDFEEDGELDGLLLKLQSREEKIRESLDGYRATSLTPEEVTAETVTGHRLLCDGLEAWLAALGALAEAAESGGAWEPGLEAAERGNRLLLAVQRLNQRVASQASNVK